MSFSPRQKYASHVVHTNGPYVSSMCVLCNVGSLALHIIMYTYLPEKPTWYAKSRGDYFKAAIPMMPEENKAIASFSLDNFLDLNFMLHIQSYVQLFLKQFIF